MGGSKKTTETTPWKPAQPYIIQNLKDTQQAFNQNQPELQGFSNDMRATYGRLAPGAEAGIMGAQGLVNRNLSGANLNGNPWLDAILERTRENVTNGVNSQFNAAGRFGSGAYQGVLSKQLADAENSLRFQNYGMEREIQQNSVSDAQNLMGGATGLLNNAAQLPWIGVQAQNGGTTQLSSPYSTRTEKTNPGLANTLLGVGGSVLGAAGGAGGFGKLFSSDERMKNVKAQVGTDPKTGLPLYAYDYKGDEGNTQVGPMAQDVEQVRPDAVATMPNGMKAVDYGKIDMPAPTSLMARTPDIQKPGLDGFAERFINPDTSKPGGGLGLLGQYLMASAEGTPFQALGQNLLAGRQIRERDALASRRLDQQDAENEAEAAWRRAQIDRINTPQPTAMMQNFDWYSGLTPEQQRVARLMLPGAGLDPTVQAPLIAQRAGQQEALVRLRADLRPPPGGAPDKPGMAGGFPVISSPAQYAALPSGATFRAPDGSIRRKR
jgi:hypothetical protein